MGWKKYLKDSMVMDTSVRVFNQVISGSKEVIEKMDLPEKNKQKLVTYIQNDVYANRLYPQNIESYVKSVMKKLDI